MDAARDAIHTAPAKHAETAARASTAQSMAALAAFVDLKIALLLSHPPLQKIRM